MTRLKRDEYLKQLNKINEEIVEKKNVRNNCLINNVLGMIREGSLIKDEDMALSRRKGSLKEIATNTQGKDRKTVNNITGP